MSRWILLAIVAVISAGCATAGPRPPVVARDAGQIDGEKSISSMSDRDWTVESEPDLPADGEPEAGAESATP